MTSCGASHQVDGHLLTVQTLIPSSFLGTNPPLPELMPWHFTTMRTHTTLKHTCAKPYAATSVNGSGSCMLVHAAVRNASHSGLDWSGMTVLQLQTGKSLPPSLHVHIVDLK